MLTVSVPAEIMSGHFGTFSIEGKGKVKRNREGRGKQDGIKMGKKRTFFIKGIMKLKAFTRIAYDNNYHIIISVI